MAQRRGSLAGLGEFDGLASQFGRVDEALADQVGAAVAAGVLLLDMATRAWWPQPATRPAPRPPWIAGGCIAPAMAGITIIGQSREAAGRRPWRHPVWAVAPVSAGVSGSLPAVSAVGAVVSRAQLALARRL